MAESPRKPRVVVVGLNFGAIITKALHSGAAREFFTLAGVCTLHAVRSNDSAQRYGVRAHESLDEVLADLSE